PLFITILILVLLFIVVLVLCIGLQRVLTIVPTPLFHVLALAMLLFRPFQCGQQRKYFLLALGAESPGPAEISARLAAAAAADRFVALRLRICRRCLLLTGVSRSG
ncbi:hypothetical protein Vafri_11275, partial [Volvox africanus]